jgi:hypothetical protein
MGALFAEHLTQPLILMLIDCQMDCLFSWVQDLVLEFGLMANLPLEPSLFDSNFLRLVIFKVTIRTSS